MKHEPQSTPHHYPFYPHFYSHVSPYLIATHIFSLIIFNWRTKHVPPHPSAYQLVYIHQACLTLAQWADLHVCLTWGKSWSNPGCLSCRLHKLQRKKQTNSIQGWMLKLDRAVITLSVKHWLILGLFPPAPVFFSPQPECVGLSPPPSRWAASMLGPGLWKKIISVCHKHTAYSRLILKSKTAVNELRKLQVLSFNSDVIHAAFDIYRVVCVSLTVWWRAPGSPSLSSAVWSLWWN